ncbi:MAG: alcohol dehydrogenase catalytic domain-containing protein [Anaerolineaceae bacterium]
MKAIWLENKTLSVQEDLPIPVAADDEAFIRLRMGGICSTDLEMVKGYYPFRGVLGHEFVGEVVEAAQKPELVGKRVVGEITLCCGECEACLNGRTSHCENRRTLGLLGKDGVFAEYLTLPIQNLHIVPDTLPDEQAVFTELLAAALEIQQEVQIKPADRVVVVGAGRLGLLIAQCLNLTGCDLSVVVRRSQPAILLEKWGIKAVYAQDLPKHKADLVVEVTGSAEGFALSRSLVRPRGTLLLKSTFAGEMSLNLSSIVVDEIKVVGSRCGPFAPALRLLEQGKIDVHSLINAKYSLSEGMEAFDEAAKPGMLKVLLTP